MRSLWRRRLKSRPCASVNIEDMNEEKTSEIQNIHSYEKIMIGRQTKI